MAKGVYLGGTLGAFIGLSIYTKQSLVLKKALYYIDQNTFGSSKYSTFIKNHLGTCQTLCFNWRHDVWISLYLLQPTLESQQCKLPNFSIILNQSHFFIKLLLFLLVKWIIVWLVAWKLNLFQCLDSCFMVSQVLVGWILHRRVFRIPLLFVSIWITRLL